MSREYYTSFELWQLVAVGQGLTIQVRGTVYRAYLDNQELGFYDRSQDWGRLDCPVPELELDD